MLDQLGNGLLLGIIISVASVALSLLYGVTRIVNFAHGEIIALGAIVTLFFSSRRRHTRCREVSWARRCV